VAASPVEAMLAPLQRISGFVLASLVDADSGMVLGAVSVDDGMSVPVASAGAADAINALSLMTSRLALPGDLEDVIVTLNSHYHLVQVFTSTPAGQLILLVTLNRRSANLAMARHEVRETASAAASQWLRGRPQLDAAPADQIVPLCTSAVRLSPCS
jgi:predicted regulator of Ras-like GTPase activity (Roadblock/LC7/MglB family)